MKVQHSFSASNRSSGLYSGDVTKSIWKLSFPSHSKICANEAPSKTIGGMNIEYICNWGVLALICFMPLPTIYINNGPDHLQLSLAIVDIIEKI